MPQTLRMTALNLTTSGTRGYGNDDSVYITVEAGDVDENEALLTAPSPT